MSLPAPVQRHLQREEIHAARVACLSFDADWRLLGRSGAISELGLTESDDVLERQFRELCHGQSPMRGGRVPQVNLGQHQYADLHLVAEEKQFHVIVIDVSERLQGEQALQQSAQESKLRSYEQGRFLRELKQQLLLTEAERDAARGQVLELVMQAELQGQRLQGALTSVDAEVRRLLKLDPGKGGRLRAEQLLEQALTRIAGLTGEARQAIGRLLGDIPQDGERPTEELDPDMLAAALYASLRSVVRETGVRIDLRTQRRSSEPLRFAEGCVQEACQLALWQALLRTPSGDVQAALRWDGQFLQLQIESTAPDLDTAEADALWEQKLPAAGAAQAQSVLFGLGRLLHRHAGRALVQPLNGRTRLLISLPARIDRDRGDITSPNFRGPVWLFSADRVFGEELLAQFAARGVDLRQHDVDERELRQALEIAPPAMLFDLDVNPEASVLAFKLRVRGYVGALVALGGPEQHSGALAATWRHHLPRSTSPQQLLRVLAG